MSSLLLSSVIIFFLRIQNQKDVEAKKNKSCSIRATAKLHKDMLESINGKRRDQCASPGTRTRKQSATSLITLSTPV